MQLYDKINLENCDGYKKNTADEFMITVKTSNVTKKHSCSIPCADSTVSATTTSSATASATTTEAGTTSSTTTQAPTTTTTTTGAATTTTSSAIVNVYTCARLLDCPASNRTLSYVVKMIVQIVMIHIASMILMDLLSYHMLIQVHILSGK